MVRDITTVLHALHEVLVAARNTALEDPGTPVLADIVDSIEAIPLWMADPLVDRTEDIVRTFEGLASEYPACSTAARTVSRLRSRRDDSAEPA